MTNRFWQRGVAPLIPLVVVGAVAVVTAVTAIISTTQLAKQRQTTSTQAAIRYKCQITKYSETNCLGNITSQYYICSYEDKTGQCTRDGSTAGLEKLKYDSCTPDRNCRFDGSLTPTPPPTGSCNYNGRTIPKGTCCDDSKICSTNAQGGTSCVYSAQCLGQGPTYIPTPLPTGTGGCSAGASCVNGLVCPSTYDPTNQNCTTPFYSGVCCKPKPTVTPTPKPPSATSTPAPTTTPKPGCNLSSCDGSTAYCISACGTGYQCRINVCV
ncbi:hypothetical protein HYW87_04195, partial [Candidatus Roizmanbacteria bacterium]|nr:hypothetical protein [Candidatus Roizmanbacteria bacterium]